MSEIERLRELVDAGKEDRKEIDRLVDENGELAKENERLRDLLKRIRNGVVNGTIVGTARGYLLKKIEEEVGDE